jgi:Tfp pilus assembly protein PilN
MNNTLHLDFAGKPRLANKLGWALLLGGLTLLALTAASVYPLLRTQEQTKVDLEKAETLAAAMRAPKKSLMTAKERSTVNRALEIQHQLLYPWKGLLTLMEAEQQQDVALLGLDPKFPTSQIRITAEAKDTQAMLVYVDRLQKNTLLEYPTLTTQQLMTRQPGVPIKFQVVAKWKSANPKDAFFEVSAASPVTQTSEAEGAFK